MGADGPAQFPARAQSLRILCIDGGGIKGYTALLILRRIFRTLSADMGGNLSPRPCDIFDLIAGTSTGGIIAVMLGRLHMTIDECIEVYERLGKDVFGRPVGGQVGRVLRGMTSSPFYDIADLQQSIRSVLRARGIESDEPFIEREGPGCKVILCATRVETGKADVLRNYKSGHPTAENYSCRIWEAASATAAAPMYFKSVKFASGGERWCDGAIRRNNPIDEALAELAREPEWRNREIGCILSLGTGLARSRSVSSNLASFLKGALKMLTDAEDTAKVFSASALGRQLAQTCRYYRFNVPHGMEDLQLDEWKATERMKALTTEYLSHADNGDAILSCAKSLLYPDENSYDETLREFFRPEMGPTQIFALWGLGGVGKTQIALQFAQSMKDKLSVFWIRADSLANFIADFSRLLPLLDPEAGKSASSLDVTSLLEKTRDKLEAQAGEWLLILDNADHLGDFVGTSAKSELSISKYVPRRGRILITTRDRRFQGSVAAASDGLCVEPMTLSEATELLLKSVPKHLVQPSAVNTLMANDLVEELGCLPLAIAQAAANIVDQQMSFSEYVGLFRHEKRRRADLMNSPAYDFANKDPRNGSSSVAITWKISIDALERQSHLSVTFLEYLACFHWRDVPQSLLRHLPEFRDLDDISFLRLTKKPLALSLIDQTLDQDPTLSTYSVHPVLHEIMTDELSAQDKCRMLDHLMPNMSRLFPTAPYPTAESWPLASLLAPHLSRQLSLCQEVGYSSSAVATLMFSLSRFHSLSRMQEAAADLAEAGLAMAGETFGADDDLIPHFRQNAIERLDEAGRYDSVEAECSLALERLELRASSLDRTAYNKEKVKILTFLFNAIRGRHDYQRLGAVNEELLRCQQLEQWSPGEDALHRHNLAYGLLRSGKRAEAKEINDELLRYCETDEGIKVVGKKLHLIMLNLKVLVMRTGTDVWLNLDEIVALYERIFLEHLSHFGINDKETWISLNNCLGSLSQALRMDEVGDVLWAVLPAAIGANVKADGSIAISMLEIYGVAMLYRDYLSKRRAVDGTETATSRATEFAQLLERWSYVAGIQKTPRPVDYVPTPAELNSLNSHGVYHQFHGRYREAEAMHRRVIQELRDQPDDPLNPLSHYNLMLAIARDDREDEAFAFRREHAHLIAPMEAIYGTLEQRQDERQKEMSVYEEAKALIERGSLRRSDQWWLDNGAVVGRVGSRLGHKLAPLE
ncbi:hypothetical protein CHGG_08432 [Chaetomium globosum CBS 148.51]|uniref:PNPLA domain-containing protein n=1 Tax=Chaetomium globosum (strain ATCC 6205 / CBS 148.51 / DSM 1962 / NBRC 6347 / NRRL 1970) TaxID=306901 RepID=Q2GUC2_CHAGB|nr:uncharacterized protein CHGG_08432 [Chaetomium globosum CBS 148.51]EAQ84418.1 hypothetical protein CHGG_08432 [Chaetomium globosum CBS 148.51]